MNVNNITVYNLTIGYYHDPNELIVLKDLNITLDKNKFNVLVGPSGCGKTTLLLALSNLLDLFDISVYKGNINIFNYSPSEAQYNKIIGMAFQNPSLLPWLSVYDNVALPLLIGNNNKNDDLSVKNILEFSGLINYGDYFPFQLSGGLSQRVNLARALVLKPQLLLLDEPVSHLDYISRLNLLKLIRKLHNKFNMTTIMVTHDLREAILIADDIYIFTQRNPTIIKKITIRQNLLKKKDILEESNKILQLEKKLIYYLKNFR